MRNNCIFKNSLQEGPVSTPLVGGFPYTVYKQGACYRTRRECHGVVRLMLFCQYKTLLSLNIAFMIFGGS